jgi:RNA polymerase sigma-70 factor (ECF subfamily)
MEASRSVHRSTLGDAAFDQLVRTHRPSLERHVRSLGASREDAEEIVATALLRAYQNPPTAHVEREWRAWLSTVARNLWIDERRRRQVRLVTGDRVLEAVPSPPVDQVAATAEEARQICAAIALLPPTQRAAVYLREVRGLSYEEIADELAMTLKAVTATLHRARGNVRHRRGGLAEAFSGFMFLPLVLLRRGAGAARSAGAAGTAAKAVLPVVLVAGAGGAAVVAQHASAGARKPEPRAAIRWMAPPSGAAEAKRAAFGILGLVVSLPRAPRSGDSAPRDAPASGSTARLPGDPEAVAAATEADVSASAPAIAQNGSEPAAHPAKPAHVVHARHARTAGSQHTSSLRAQHARTPPVHARAAAAEGRGKSADRHAGAPPASTRASSRNVSAAHRDRSAVAQGPSAAGVGGGSQERTFAPAAPASQAEPHGDAPAGGAPAGGAPAGGAPVTGTPASGTPASGAPAGAAGTSTQPEPAAPPAHGKSTS